MKAIVLTQYGSPDDLELKDIETPTPNDDEVLVKVQATSVNDWDWCLVRGSPFYIRLLCGWRKPNIQIPGAEVAGRVTAVGPNVTQFQPEDAVYGDISECGFGGFAEYVCVPETALALMPERMAFTEAAAIPHAAMLAVQGLMDVGQLQPGQKLLINGAGGGVGTLGVQIARAIGVKDVTGVDRASKFALMRSVGFTHTIDYTQTDFTTGQERYDLILDTKTNRSPFKYLQVLNPGGTYVTVGGLTPRLFQVLLFEPMIRWFTQKTVRLVNLQPNKDLAYVNELFAAGQLKPAIDGPYHLSEVPRLIQYFGAGQHQGKVIITLNPHRTHP
ncbi:NADPH:quinone reductase [Halomicronema hongdechloris C2206]|uniref:NADPH:quinone reductase n=1 Tax=Halomicronema hongdechloris C2206 TaxID=1641165 RepID=A0A1Z3HJX9_9CYAN|nr:NAD(P)-dependent alcohol dehydrogenase [Halomicronema hongdechloris]ASC70619.1 NADPH:quinone reductase [Halomicronema hongdechloris C2206]